MRRCPYPYCQEPLADGAAQCPVCGQRLDGSSVSLDQAMAELPRLPVDRVIDMHQILIAKEGMLEAQLAMMKAVGIDRALLQSVPSKVRSMLSNRQLAEVGKSHPEAFIVSHFMDPRYPLALRRLRQYRERGVRVIKLLPCFGYRPDAPRFRKFFGTLERLGLHVMVHTGFITARHKDEERRAGIYLNSEYGRPIFFDELARRYPGIQFILCHMGGSIWTHEAVEMVAQHDNVWGDLSGSGAKALRRMVTERMPVAWEKLFWGNDSSPLAYGQNLRIFLHLLELGGLSNLAPALLHDNAHNFLKDHIL